jgi:hypothetical protein
MASLAVGVMTGAGAAGWARTGEAAPACITCASGIVM